MEIKNEGWNLNFSGAMQSYALDLVNGIDNKFSFHERVDYEDNSVAWHLELLEGRIY